MGRWEWVGWCATVVGLGLGLVSMSAPILGYDISPQVASVMFCLGVVLVVAGPSIVVGRWVRHAWEWLGQFQDRRARRLDASAVLQPLDVRTWAGDIRILGHAADSGLFEVLRKFPRANTADRAFDSRRKVEEAESAVVAACNLAPTDDTILARLLEYYEKYAAYVSLVHWLGRDIGQTRAMSKWAEYLRWRRLDNDFRGRLLQDAKSHPELGALHVGLSRIDSTEKHHLQ